MFFPSNQQCHVDAARLAAVRGVAARISWFAHTEGSADYARLLKEIPPTLRVPGL